jgi:hypothetical protein
LVQIELPKDETNSNKELQLKKYTKIVMYAIKAIHEENQKDDSHLMNTKQCHRFHSVTASDTKLVGMCAPKFCHDIAIQTDSSDEDMSV